MASRVKKFWLSLLLVCAAALPVSAPAADRTTVGVGTGAVAGALVGGPIGAVIGAVAGGVIGANSEGVRRGGRRRVRLAQRRRSAKPASPPVARATSAPDPIRPVAVASPARPPAPDAQTTGSAGWKDPR